MFDNDEEKKSHENASYNEQIFSKKKNKKRKRKIYKSILTKFVFSSQSIESFFESFFKRSFQFSLKIINLRRSNVQVSQISTTKLIIRLRIIRYLYENHSDVEFSHTVRNIYETVIDHFNDSDSNNTKNYTYRFSFLKSIKSSFTDSIFILNTSDSCDLFRLTTRTSQSSSKSQQQQSKSQSCFEVRISSIRFKLSFSTKSSTSS